MGVVVHMYSGLLETRGHGGKSGGIGGAGSIGAGAGSITAASARSSATSDGHALRSPITSRHSDLMPLLVSLPYRYGYDYNNSLRYLFYDLDFDPTLFSSDRWH